MSAHMKKHHTKKSDFIYMRHAGVVYQFPKKVANKYRVNDQSISADEVFADINKQFTRSGALLKGLRIRESLTQVVMAKKIKVTQSDISQMENGTRVIGRVIAKRIEALLGVDYRSFLE